mmetsp:Transcript_17762/g.26504  ORF Transcript_17762/g.26504 Transcript_17762/m.26504 type:complete len:181 (+) Transcript_17762:356-898(+)
MSCSSQQHCSPMPNNQQHRQHYSPMSNNHQGSHWGMPSSQHPQHTMPVQHNMHMSGHAPHPPTPSSKFFRNEHAAAPAAFTPTNARSAQHPAHAFNTYQFKLWNEHAFHGEPHPMHPTPLFRQEAPTPPFQTDQPQEEKACLRTKDFRETMEENYGEKLVEIQALERQQDPLLQVQFTQL